MLIAFAWAPAAHGDTSATVAISCGAGERRLYLTVVGRGGNGVQLYCADRTTPSGSIPFATDRVPVQIEHDRMGNLFVLWHKIPWVDESRLTIFDATGATLVERPAPRLGRHEWMFVDRNRSTAYFVYFRSLVSDTKFARFEPLFRSVGIERESDDVSIPISIQADAATIDQLGRILVNAYLGQPGYSAILDPQKQRVVDSVYAPACAMAAGADGLVYAANCVGELRAFNPKNYRLVSDLKLDVGSPYLGDANYHGRLAIDPTGTVFVSNQALGTLLRYNHGETKPSATATNVPHIVDLELDSAGNVYALEGDDAAIKTSMRVFSGRTLEQIREYDFDSKECVVFGMTIIDP